MKWNRVEIKDLSNNDLLAANTTLKEMNDKTIEKRKSVAFIVKMQKQPTTATNPVFMDLQKEIQAEITNRKL